MNVGIWSRCTARAWLRESNTIASVHGSHLLSGSAGEPGSGFCSCYGPPEPGPQESAGHRLEEGCGEETSSLENTAADSRVFAGARSAALGPQLRPKHSYQEKLIHMHMVMWPIRVDTHTCALLGCLASEQGCVS